MTNFIRGTSSVLASHMIHLENNVKQMAFVGMLEQYLRTCDDKNTQGQGRLRSPAKRICD